MTTNLLPEDQLLENGVAQPAEDFSWLDGESEEEVIAKVNKVTGKHYKSIDDVAKSIKSADETIAKLGRQTQTPQSSQSSPDDIEVMFFEAKPEAALVDDDLANIAKSLGMSNIQAWKTQSWIREKAESLAREEKRKETDAKKVLMPSGQPGGSNDYSAMTDEQILDLPPAEAEKAFKARANR